MFTACFPTEPFFFGFLGYVRGDAPGTAVGRALFAKYILGAPFFFGPSPAFVFGSFANAGGGVRPPSSHRFLNEFQTGSRASGVRPLSRHGGTDTPTINCALRGGKIRTTCLFRASEDLRFLPSVRLETSREL